MKLKAVVDSLDEVDEKYRDLYTSFQDGDNERFKLNIEGTVSHPDTVALRNSFDRVKGQVRQLGADKATLQQQVDNFPEDFDAELYQRAVTEGVGNPNSPVKNEAEIRREATEAGKQAGRKELQKDLDKAATDRDKFKARVERGERNAALDAALDDAKVTDPVFRKAAKAMLGQNLKVIFDQDTGEVEVLATDPLLGDTPVAEHVKSWAGTDEGKAFVGPRDSAGGGANGTQPGGTPPSTDINPWKADTFNATMQARLKQENPRLAERYQREAAVR